MSDLAPTGHRGAWLSTLATAQGAGQALGLVGGGYAMAAGRFDLAFIAAGAIGVLSPALVSRLSFPGAGHITAGARLGGLSPSTSFVGLVSR